MGTYKRQHTLCITSQKLINNSNFLKLKNMKKILFQTVLLIIIGALNSATLNAQTNYDLWIAGTQVTSDNADDLSAIEGVYGTVSYDNDTKILTLDNATINTDNMAIKNENIADLQIKLIGNNNLTSENNSTVSFNANTEINGDGSLIVTSNWINNDVAAIDITGGSVLTIKNCKIEASSESFGIAGWNEGESLVINNAMVKATGKYGSIGSIDNLTLIDCTITSPEGAVFNEDENYIVDSEGNYVTEQVVIEPTTGIQDVENMKDIAIYPNPVNDILHIELSENNFGVELYNIFGQQVLKAQNEREISVSELSSGVYVLKITTEKGIYSRKIVKE